MKARVAKMRRLTDLFDEGSEVVLGDPTDPVVLWVTKPNSFEKAEADKDGQAGRARRVLRFDRDEDEQDILAAQTLGYDDARLIDALVESKANEHYIKALNEIRAREDWAERLTALDRADLLTDRGDAVDEEEQKVFDELNRDYIAEITRTQERLGKEYRAELSAKTRPDLEKLYHDVYRDLLGVQAFLEERRITELWYSIRLCDAVASGEGWDHARCDHRTRLAENRHEVRDLPDQVLYGAAEALQMITMTPADAGNSAAPSSSSGSSEPTSAPEESTASTPAGT